MRRISMNMIKSTLKLAMILYICVALTGVYALSASAKITPRDDSDEETTLITIEKGDTLWDLCQEHLKDPLKWRELSKNNDFTNPDLIYPG
ncbi:LysM peptidoglycan-binding domain-containing protein, partial [Candidatus Poribacteria bacterium]|nr:LysM peptidoglycan-binding domain-containing protein [Candidatus Poribacteria bacterium]